MEMTNLLAEDIEDNWIPLSKWKLAQECKAMTFLTLHISEFETLCVLISSEQRIRFFEVLIFSKHKLKLAGKIISSRILQLPNDWNSAN